MNYRQTLTLLAMACLPFLVALPVHADHHQAGHSTDSAEKVNAEIRKIDAANGKVTLKHEALPQFSMGAMTMVFRVENPTLLDNFSVGDRVRFVPAKKNGQFVVESMEKTD